MKGRQKKEKKEPLLQRMGFPAQALPFCTQILLSGNESLQAQGASKLLAYSPTELIVQTGKKTFAICGQGLRVGSFCNGYLEVHGVISSVQWKEEKR